jgi:hypothetical protein
MVSIEPGEDGKPLVNKRNIPSKPHTFTRCVNACWKHRTGPPSARERQKYPKRLDMRSDIIPKEGLLVGSFEYTQCSDGEASVISKSSFSFLDVGRTSNCHGPCGELESDFVLVSKSDLQDEVFSPCFLSTIKYIIMAKNGQRPGPFT